MSIRKSEYRCCFLYVVQRVRRGNDVGTFLERERQWVSIVSLLLLLYTSEFVVELVPGCFLNVVASD